MGGSFDDVALRSCTGRLPESISDTWALHMSGLSCGSLWLGPDHMRPEYAMVWHIVGHTFRYCHASPGFAKPMPER